MPTKPVLGRNDTIRTLFGTQTLAANVAGAAQGNTAGFGRREHWDLRQIARRRISGIRIHEATNRFVADLPRTASGKVLHRAI